jgi:hypothetical protein
MKRHLVLRYLKLWNLGFCFVSGFELVAFIVFSFFTPIFVVSQNYTIFSLLFISGLSPLHMPLLWVLIFISIIIFIIFAFILIIIARNEKIENITYAKILLSTGFFLLIANFIKVEAIYIMSKSIFELLLYNPANTPFYGAALWIYSTASVCTYLISGLVFAAIGLKWMLLLENKGSS